MDQFWPILAGMKLRPLFSSTLLCIALTLSSSAEPTPPIAFKDLMHRPHPELPDKDIIVKRIDIQPGAASPAHAHPGMVTGYVQSGDLEFQLKGQPLQNLKAGDTFFEAPGSHHLVARNPGKTVTTIIIFVVNPKDTPLSTPLADHKEQHPASK